jgi:isoamylase/glycogen operon protein
VDKEELKMTSPGSPSPLGLSKTRTGWNIALFSHRATQVTIGLFYPNSQEPYRTIPLTQSADIWHIGLENIPPETLYAFQCEGPWNESVGDLFDPTKWLADPFAKALDTSPIWNKPHSFPPVRAPFLKPNPFDWQDTPRPNIPKSDLIIYEMHVRGFTADPSSKSSAPGTYRALIEQIPYFKKLGVNAIELMPIFEFDERHNKTLDPDTQAPLPNYWGYNSISFFAPKRNFSHNTKFGGPIDEFKELVRELHKTGIEVILDVVYNHTGEGKEHDYAISWRGIDNRTYYLIDRSGHYRDFTGCGNTVNANNPAVRFLILESLRYWVEEMQVDGFRFDLASILTRGPDTHPMDHPPLIESISKDPILSKVKLIAESWDAAGLYQLGTFPKWGPWSEWNGRYRDIVRRFLKGTCGKAGRFAAALSGSDFLYASSHTPLSSINFVTAHDGFSLRDLVTYQAKHNWANGEKNKDGTDQNDNWNCGFEGPTTLSDIQALRDRQMRNYLLALFLSQGIPMLLMGDEYGHTRNGNNNPYVQDNSLNWFLWDELKSNTPIFNFVSSLIQFRKNYPELRLNRFLTPEDIQWHGREPHQPDWSPSSRLIAYTTHSLYITFNAHFEPATITLPAPCHLIVNTADEWSSHHFKTPGPALPTTLTLAPYSALVAKL